MIASTEDSQISGSFLPRTALDPADAIDYTRKKGFIPPALLLSTVWKGLSPDQGLCVTCGVVKSVIIKPFNRVFATPNHNRRAQI